MRFWEKASEENLRIPDLKVDEEKKKKKRCLQNLRYQNCLNSEVLGKPVKTISEISDLKVDRGEEEEEEYVFRN